jgi:transposase InsO family protein
VAFRRWLGALNNRRGPNRSPANAADLLGLGGPCLDAWTRRWKSGRRRAEPRGRPPAQAPDDTLAKAVELFNDLGPGTSTATLMGHCPELGRNEASKILAELRRQCQEDYRATINALQWMRPGTVWAMDHTRPPGAVDGLYPYILLVRDLAGHFQLGAIPQEAATDKKVADVLEDLFKRHGAPLVIKFDNHGAFTGREVRQVLEKHGVLPLVSPPYFPPYNGSIEAGGGQFQTRAHILAARMNHPGEWTSNDVEGARIMANRTLRPWGKDGPTPEERWKTRRPISRRERADLKQAYDIQLAEYMQNPPPRTHDDGIAIFRVERTDGAPLAPWAKIANASPTPGYRRPGEPAVAKDVNEARKKEDETAISTGQSRKNVVHYERMKRRSLQDVLVAAGLLIIRKRRIPLPIYRLMRLKIS